MRIEVKDSVEELQGRASVTVVITPQLKEDANVPAPHLSLGTQNPNLELYLPWEKAEELMTKLEEYLRRG